MPHFLDQHAARGRVLDIFQDQMVELVVWAMAFADKMLGFDLAQRGGAAPLRRDRRQSDRGAFPR